MPNHVTNKVKFIGIANQINELVNKLSTFHEKNKTRNASNQISVNWVNSKR